ARGLAGAGAPRPPARGTPAERGRKRAMKSVSPFSAEPARGWLPPGVLAPFLCIALVTLPDLAATLLLRRFHLLDAKGDPNGPLSFCFRLEERRVGKECRFLGGAEHGRKE